ncbi:DUF3592 domain-containing protein [Verrucomicrobium sp. BvORR106]|uniref:DUF3592 domain-containing protein n=1 Tax=Verrucomicrobium sp. BvORR106 TaxID=1403819 RepID=UPI002240F2F5|nr:DUF3592 domain-containing protein [Verrucomicrobium sp. BvORR106]
MPPLSIIATWAGLFFLLWGVIQACQLISYYRRSVTTIGTVKAYRRHTVTRGRRFPVVQFKPDPGPRVEFESKFGRNWEKYPVGSQVPVRYLPGTPESAKIDSAFEIWWDIPWFIALGLGLIAFGSQAT